MIDIRSVLPERLKLLFAGETQESIGQKLGAQQGTVSRWMSGEIVVPTEMLLLIAEAYKVSVDWLLGLSDEKQINGIAYEQISYEQAIRILDHLLNKGAIVHPDMNTFEVEREDTDGEEDELPEAQEPRYDTDYLHVNDRALSYMLRRRMKVIELEDDYYVLWKGRLGIFEGIKLLDYDCKMQEAINAKPWANYRDADWKEILKKLGAMTKEEIEAYIEKCGEEVKENG